jgi:hypothetical protein
MQSDIHYQLEGFSLSAFLTRLNAAWFEGRMSATQRRCASGFAAVYMFYTRIRGQPFPVSWLAYVLATTYHETAYTMAPIEEYGHGNGRPYGVADPDTGQVYYGRGYVQLTWKENYARAQEVVTDFSTLEKDIPFVQQAELALDPAWAAQIAVNGMAQGWFTGTSLGDYLTHDRTDYVNARRIINGTDKADTIAGYATEAEAAVRLALGQPASRSTVKEGSRGTDVRELQLMLECEPDGVAGNDTINALRQFQQANGLSVDGICGIQTWEMLDNIVYRVPTKSE